MFKALLKKQMSEIGSFLVINPKTGQKRTTSNRIVYGILLLAVLAMMFGIFGYLSFNMVSLAKVSLDWFYFGIMGLISVALGVFGSVFNTFSSLYLAKDNEALISMPIPSRMILYVRMAGVYVMGLVYEAMVFVPAIVVYQIACGFSVKVLIFSLLTLFTISILVLVLSCVLGWLVAIISVNLKSKSFITVLVSLIFIAAYYYVYGKAAQLLSDVVLFGEKYAKGFKSALFLFYYMGNGAVGKASDFLIFAGINLLLLALCICVLSKTFLAIATTKKGTNKKAYKESIQKVNSPAQALLGKEFIRFTKSSTYMLNCGLGLIIYLILAGTILIKGKQIVATFNDIWGDDKGLYVIFVIGMICLVASMNDITAPSISLEGKNLWILRTLPVNGWDILKAKLKLHFILNAIPAFVAFAACAYVFDFETYEYIMIPVICAMFILMSAMLGLILNLNNANFSWTNETAPIKQSAPVFITLFGGWIIAGLSVVGYVFAEGKLSAYQYQCIILVVYALAVRLMLSWLKKTGVKIFENY